ncbi:unnamed protein product [Darwinula stevensoni]|uniref:P-type domain-containing protein n=1 Tax=Darwinula stevensoni TaxID=69355 RepID=A0A7R9A8U3_9CRUS|nr:unnamed protein product [Darwinula stevensoni]CAG0896750.1 unnamed protein product [Darwinula stevensoni]
MNYDVIKDYMGRACTRRCYKQKKGKEDYVCFVNADHDWGYCSPQPGKTSKNKVCKRNHQCEKHGEDHYWCKTEGGSWDYCSPLSERRSGSRWVDADGFYCKDNCDYRGSTYTWCHSDNNQGWGFCSKIQNVATNGKKCKDDSPCRKDGTHYYFCYTEGGGWDYCGDVEDGGPWLVEKRTIDPPCDFSNPSSRVDCGWSGILQAQCESLGCCHDATYKDHYNCFYKHVDCAKLIFHAADNWYTLETNGDSRTGVQAWRYSNFTLTDTNYDLKKGAVSECSEKDSVLNRDIYNQVVHRLTDQQGNMAGQIKIIEPNDDGNPIQAVHVRLLDHVGADGHVSRVEALRAVIRQSHVNLNNRADFPWNTKQYMLDKLNGEAQDEVFRLVDSELGGPPELYNMIPGHNSALYNSDTKIAH